METTLKLGGFWVNFLLLWVLFVFQVNMSELLVGMAASAIAVLALHVSLSAVPWCFKPKRRWLLQAWRLPKMIAVDLLVLTNDLFRRVLKKRSRSRFEVLKFSATSGDCHAAAQRALAILYVSTSPNSIVVHVDRKKKELLLHKLKPQPVPELVERLQR